MQKATTVRALGLMALFNEVDIVEQTLEYHINEGFEFLVLDNGSTDGSLEIAESFIGRGVIGVRRVSTETYRWGYLLDVLTTWAEDIDADWCFLIDADTFLEAPAAGLPLLDAIRNVERAGCNVINFDNFEFWPVGDEVAEITDVRSRLRYYTWADDREEKGWRCARGARNSRTGGHVIDLPPTLQKAVCPYNFVMRHYRIRSYEQGVRKVFRERIPRFVGEPSNWHTHYNGFGMERHFFEIPKELLTRRVEGEAWDRQPRFHGWESKRLSLDSTKSVNRSTEAP